MGKYPHIVLPPGHVTVIAPVEPVFRLDGFDYYYQELHQVYWAIDSEKPNATVTVNNKNPRPLHLRYNSFTKIKKDAQFAFDHNFQIVKSISRPVKIHLLAIKQMIQIHQVMTS